MPNGEEIKKIIINGVKTVFKPILVLAIIVVLLVSLFWAVIDGVGSSISRIFSDVVDNVKISGNNIEIDQEYLENAKEQLDLLGINSTTLGLGNNEEYLERFLEAEIVTSFPYLGGDGLQGAVYFERARIDGSTIQLKYIEYNEFYSKVDNGDSDINDYFTVDQDDWTVHVMKNDGNIEKINYKNMVEKFAMPFEFPIYLAMVSQNPQFALAVVKLVKESRIVITIAESKTTTTTTNTESYHQVVKVNGNVTQSSDVQGEPDVKVEETYSSDVFLSRAQTWILNEVTDLNYDETPEDAEPVVTPKTPSSTVSSQIVGNDRVETTHSNITNTTEVHRDYQRWIRGTTKVIENTKNFINLILRDDNLINGQGLVEIAKNCHDAVANAKFTYGATSGGIPVDVNTDSRIDCSGYVSWVLYEAGYTEMAGGQHTTANSSLGAFGQEKGWEIIQNADDVQAGDICFYRGSLNGSDPGHVNICAGEQNGQKVFYDCGSTTVIQTIDPITYDMSTFGYAFRPNDEIAQALNPQDKEELRDQIQGYIDAITEGTYSVKVVNLDRTSDAVTINNGRVESNGLIKIFIMATAYDEIRQGHLNEGDISADLERMITADDNSAANSVLRAIGNANKGLFSGENEDEIQRGVDVVNEYLRSNGYNATKLEGELDQNEYEGNEQTYTTVNNVATILQNIFNGRCINEEYSEKMMNLLRMQVITDMIPSTIIVGEGETANKTGEQADTVQDAAIISTSNANYLIIVSAKDVQNTDTAKNNIREIAKIVNTYFTQNGNVNDNSDNFEEDDELDIRMNGNRVCYKLTSNQYQCPLNNLVEGREMLFELLRKSDKTQSHERLMRYLLYLLTGNDYGVTEFDFNEFLNGSFSDVSGLYGNTPQEKVWWALINAGYSKEAAAGVLGNIEAESGFNEAAIEGGSGIGFGLCQWSYGRRTQLEAYAASKGTSASDLDTQIEFLLGEITPGGGANGYASYQLVTYNGYSADDWKNASTPEDAATAFCWSFERPGVPRMSVRTEAARRYYEQFKDATRPTGGGTTNLTQAADSVAKYLCDNNYTYRATDSTSYTFPIANNGKRTLSCSSFIQECLLQAGYSQAAGGEKLWARKDSSLSIRDFQNMGISVELITDMNALQPGDIVQYTSMYHVVMVYSVSGSNVQIKGVPEVMNNNYGYDGVTRSVSYLQQNGCYALRITN